jgi:hypothetical protein
MLNQEKGREHKQRMKEKKEMPAARKMAKAQSMHDKLAQELRGIGTDLKGKDFLAQAVYGLVHHEVVSGCHIQVAIVHHRHVLTLRGVSAGHAQERISEVPGIIQSVTDASERQREDWVGWANPRPARCRC